MTKATRVSQESRAQSALGTGDRLILALRAVFFAVVAVFLVRAAIQNWNQLTAVSVQVRAGWLVPAAILGMAGGLLFPLAWRQLVAACGSAISVTDALWAWTASQATRYIPTGAAVFFTRVAMATKRGVPRSAAGASTLLELAVTVAWQALAAGLLLPTSLVPLALRAPLVIVPAILLATLPWALGAAGRLVRGLQAFAPHELRGRTLQLAVVAYGRNLAIRNVGMACFAAAILPADWSDAALLVGAVNASILVGLLGVTPGGLGLREGALAAILAQRFDLGDAAAAAIAYRAWELGFELLWLALVTEIRRRSGNRQAQRRDQPDGPATADE